jgi:class 3 adenylate cyclase
VCPFRSDSSRSDLRPRAHGCGGEGSWAPDYPWAWTEEEWEEERRQVESDWGTEAYVRRQSASWSPSLAEDEFVSWYATLLRLGASPGTAEAIGRMEQEMDVRHVLEAIHVPTLVIHRSGGSFVREETDFIVERIAGAELAEVPGSDLLPWAGDQDTLLDEVERFLASVRDDEAQFDRVLATVLFTDIVGATATAARLGDRGWREVVERHHRIVRGLLHRYRGREVDTAGDGFFATFDGPARAVKCASAIVAALKPVGIDVRAGVHTGEVETIAGKAGGMAVVIGARVGAAAGPSEVFASQTVKDLTAGSGLAFEDAGEHELKGVPGRWQLYRVVG